MKVFRIYFLCSLSAAVVGCRYNFHSGTWYQINAASFGIDESVSFQSTTFSLGGTLWFKVIRTPWNIIKWVCVTLNYVYCVTSNWYYTLMLREEVATNNIVFNYIFFKFPVNDELNKQMCIHGVFSTPSHLTLKPFHTSNPVSLTNVDITYPTLLIKTHWNYHHVKANFAQYHSFTNRSYPKVNILLKNYNIREVSEECPLARTIRLQSPSIITNRHSN